MSYPTTTSSRATMPLRADRLTREDLLEIMSRLEGEVGITSHWALARTVQRERLQSQITKKEREVAHCQRRIARMPLPAEEKRLIRQMEQARSDIEKKIGQLARGLDLD